MRKIEVVSAERCFDVGPGPGAPLPGDGPVSERVRESEGRVDLDGRRSCSKRGPRIGWEPSHGDEALFVESGVLAVLDGEDRLCPAGGAIVIEAAGRPDGRGPGREPRDPHGGARRRRHDGRRHRRPPVDPDDRPAPRVHVIGPRGTFEALEPGRETRFFADATCPTCSLWLLYTARSFAYESPVHSHSQDELIHVLRGEVRIGSLVAGPGASIFIAAHQPYQFRSGPEGFAFLNYRRAASEMTIRGTGEKIVEAGAATGMTRVSEP